MSERLIRRKEVMHLTGMAKSTMYRYIAEGRFPRPVSLGEHAVAWRLSDVEKWMTTLSETSVTQNAPRIG
ncbi:MAG: hypothetical protein COB65_04785 [Thalassobium sp.]|nr:MAG: hypothetical protein COB65_04785 [Thalassobium sp.]